MGGNLEFKTIIEFFKKLFKREKKNPEALKGLLSKEEFLRFDIVRKEMRLEIAKVRLADFLKKGKK